jgi:hypothetical protein
MNEAHKIKITHNNNEVFFSDKDSKTAYDFADEYIDENKGKFDMNVYYLKNDKWKYLTKFIRFISHKEEV